MCAVPIISCLLTQSCTHTCMPRFGLHLTDVLNSIHVFNDYIFTKKNSTVCKDLILAKKYISHNELSQETHQVVVQNSQHFVYLRVH